jgi:hypothetical protein
MGELSIKCKRIKNGALNKIMGENKCGAIKATRYFRSLHVLWRQCVGVQSALNCEIKGSYTVKRWEDRRCGMIDVVEVKNCWKIEHT